MCIHEYAGLAPVDAFDKTSTASGTSSAADPMARASVSVTAPNELLFAYVVAAYAAATTGSGLSLRLPYAGNFTGDRIIEQPGTYEATATVAPTGYAWRILLATFKGR
jgi:hypothetical protein